MKCPACSNVLTLKVVQGVSLDTCENGCGGIWLDRLEVKKFDEKIEPDAETLLHLKINPAVHVDFDKIRKCPKCTDRIMMRHFASPKRKITIDECPECAGIWLDAGELHQIRDEFDTDQERRAAAERLFDDVFKNQSSNPSTLQESQWRTVSNVGRALRFLAPSYYFGPKPK